MSSDARTRAAEVLELSAGTTAADATGAFLAALPAADFVPSADSVAAVNALAGLAIPTDADTEPGVGLREEVEEFARNYWSLAPADRLAAWVALGNRCTDDGVTARLLALQGGLEVSTTPQPDAVQEEVAAIARELFVLPARDRAIKRNEWLLTNAERHAELSRAAAELRRRSPTTADLEPALFAQLGPNFYVAEFIAGTTLEPLATPNHPGRIELATPAYDDRFAGRPARDVETPPPAQKESPSGVSWGVGVAVVIVVIRIVAAIGSSGSSSAPKPVAPPPPSYPSYRATPPDLISKPPTFPPAGSRVFPPTGFAIGEVIAFKAYEKKPFGSPPPRYDEWVEAGKPETLMFPTAPPTKVTPVERFPEKGK